MCDEINHTFPNWKCNSWGLEMDNFIPHLACDYLSMLGFKLIHVVKRGLSKWSDSNSLQHTVVVVRVITLSWYTTQSVWITGTKPTVSYLWIISAPKTQDKRRRFLISTQKTERRWLHFQSGHQRLETTFSKSNKIHLTHCPKKICTPTM